MNGKTPKNEQFKDLRELHVEKEINNTEKSM